MELKVNVAVDNADLKVSVEQREVVTNQLTKFLDRLEHHVDRELWLANSSNAVGIVAGKVVSTAVKEALNVFEGLDELAALNRDDNNAL